MRGDGPPDPADIARLGELLSESGALEGARSVAEGYARSAVKQLELFPDSPSRRALGSLPDLVLIRDR
jgi:geranylgeranyl pyrophosphate synthase